MQVNDKVDEQRSEAEGMAKHWIESPHFCFFDINLLVTTYKFFIFQSRFMNVQTFV